MKQSIVEFITYNVSSAVARRYVDFCDWIHNETEYDPEVTSSVFTNVSLKKELAKRIVRSIRDNEDYDFYELRNSMDARLRSLVCYYWAVETDGEDSHGSGNKYPENAIVRMRPEDPLYQGYRFFIVDMLCFTADKFILGFRTDSGPVRSPMKYFKGCRPLGIKAAPDGREWNLILVDRNLTDDNTAIFSNQLDGDGNIEICDWLSDSNQRIIFVSEI